ncbi:MAG: hypothetical protein AAF969_14660 [Bacteroidota bacterium]
MVLRTVSRFLAILLLTATSCKETRTPELHLKTSHKANEKEKQAILTTLNNETKAAFQRDYELWTTYWVHNSDISKTYIDFADNTFSESVGWEEISQFVKTFIEEHPEPEPLPTLLDKIDVRLYGKGAWVTYEQHDSIRGLKRETRLMEKEGGTWKIAGMQTTIYGFQSEEN